MNWSDEFQTMHLTKRLSAIPKFNLFEKKSVSWLPRWILNSSRAGFLHTSHDTDPLLCKPSVHHGFRFPDIHGSKCLILFSNLYSQLHIYCWVIIILEHVQCRKIALKLRHVSLYSLPLWYSLPRHINLGEILKAKILYTLLLVGIWMSKLMKLIGLHVMHQNCIFLSIWTLCTLFS